MKKFLHLITLLLLLVATPSMALQLREITPHLTRTQADKSLSKDYTYKVLDDFTVRRTWTISANKRVSLDFNPQDDKLLMIMLEYGSGIDRQTAAADVRCVTSAGKTKWKRMDKKKAEKYDVPVNTLNAKTGSCYSFMEMSNSGKCRRVMIYTSLPDSNRVHLGVADTTTGGQTALGTRAGASVGKVIAEQEKLRKRTPLATETPKKNSAQLSVAPGKEISAADSAVVRTVADEQSGDVASADTLVAAKSADEEVEIVDDFEEIKVESRFSLSAIQASVGLQGVSPAMLIVGAVVVIVLLTLIGMLKKSGERKRLSRYRSRGY